MQDDSLSALDAQVGASVFENAITKLLVAKRRQTVVLVTHHVHLLQHADYVGWLATSVAVSSNTWLLSFKFHFVSDSSVVAVQIVLMLPVTTNLNTLLLLFPTFVFKPAFAAHPSGINQCL